MYFNFAQRSIALKNPTTKLFSYLLAFAALLISSVGHGTEVKTVNISDIDRQDFTRMVTYYSLPSGELPDSQQELSRWLSNLSEHDSTNTFGDRYLVAVDLVNNTEQSAWYVYPYGSVVESIDIAIYSEQGNTQRLSSGLHAKNPIDLHYGAHIELQPQEKATLLMVFDSDFFFAPIKLVLYPSEQASYELGLESVIIWLTLGICLSLGLYNLFIYWGSGQRQYLYYAVSTLFYMLGWSLVFGAIEFIFPKDTSRWLMAPYLLGNWATSYFIIEFLQLRTYSPRVAKALVAVAWVSLFCALVSIFSQGIGILLASLMTTCSLFFGLYASINAWLKGYSPARYFTFAFLSVAIPNFVGNLMNLGILPGFDVNIYLLGQLGNAADCLLLAFALADKVRLTNKENLELTTQLEEKVIQRTSALSDANKALEKAITKAQEASHAKGQFLANMSHEIRTPLTSIIGYADGVLQGDIDISEQRRVLKIIADNGNHLLAVINDILDITKIEADKLDFESIPTPLFVVLAQVESVVGKRARDKGLTFELDYQYPLPNSVNTDPTRLKQILFNLTNNALKFTDTGFISITVRIKDKQLEFFVKDSGVGMAQEQLDQLFNPFQQGDNTISRKFGGTGLGLSISSRLAQGLGGQINVISQLGHGSEFKLSIPLSIKEGVEWIEKEEDIWKSEGPSLTNEDALPDFNQAKILVADDHPSNRELVTLLLKRMNTHVVAVENGVKAVEEAYYHQFDLILMDIQMPEMDGIKALKKIREQGCSTPIIALTANSLKQEIQNYMKLGFSDHLAKPFVRREFIEKLSHYLTTDSYANGLLSNDEMLSLIKTYFDDLKNQVQRFEKATSEHDQELMQDIAHAIKGAAGSFGFQPIGEKFAEIDLTLKMDEQHNLPILVEEARSLCICCLMPPGVDIPLAIVNHGNNIGKFFDKLRQYLPGCSDSLELFAEEVHNNQLNSAQLHLYRMLPELKRFALTTLLEHATTLEGLFKQNSHDTDEFKQAFKKLRESLTALRKHLDEHD